MRLESVGVLLGCLSGLLWPTFGTAGESKPVAASLQSKYRAGFEKLFQMGLPRVPAGYRPALVRLDHDYSYGRDSISWIKENPSEHVADCFLGGLTRCRIYLPEQERKTAERMPAPLFAANPLPLYHDGMLSGSWELLEDDDVMERITAIQEKEWHSEEEKLSLRAGMLVQAAQLYATGKENAAAAIAAPALVDHDSREVLTAALNLMACGRYGEIFLDFLRDGDLRRYGDGLDKMLEQYGRYWSNAPSGKILQNLLHDRIAGRVAPLPARPFPLTPSDQEAARRLAGLNQQGWEAWWRAGAGIWLLMPPERFPAGNPVSAITGRGMAAVPLLIDMLDDTVLLPLPQSWVNACYSDNNKVVGRVDLIKELKRIKAPLTRGELAVILLRRVILPEPGNDRFGFFGDEEKFAMLAEKFYHEAKELNPDQLRKLYLQRGTLEQKDFVLQHLSHNIDDAMADMVEKVLSDNDFNLRWHPFMCDYLAARKDRAPAFMARLRKQMVAEREEYIHYIMLSRLSEDRKKRYIANAKNGFEWKFQQATGTMKKITAQEFFRQVLTDEKPGAYYLLLEGVDLQQPIAFIRQGV
ncbi:MAG: hypothetical protein PHQ27_11145, partial [Victivallales bacterium]|nr:hypothetical protein [Victivallales bacterium]